MPLQRRSYHAGGADQRFAAQHAARPGGAGTTQFRRLLAPPRSRPRRQQGRPRGAGDVRDGRHRYSQTASRGRS